MRSFSDLFSQAVESARCGERTLAMQLFQQCLEVDPGSVQVWLWISELSDKDTDRIAAMEMALALLPAGSDLAEKVADRLNKLRQAGSSRVHSSHVEPFIEENSEQAIVEKSLIRAERLRSAGDEEQALEIIEELVNRYPHNERTWLALSWAAHDRLARIRALEEALRINPYNAETAFRLAELRSAEKDALTRGSHLEAQGQSEEAIQLYLSIATHSRLPADRVEAMRRIEDIRMRQEVDNIHRVSSNIHLLRLTAGPVLLFSLMVFIQSGLNPLHTPLLALPGLLSVLMGSLILSASDMRPMHPKWVEMVGKPGHGEEPELRRWLRLLAIALLVAPFTMFLIEASYRLGVLQSSMLAR